ncbi:MAG: hypothetical protein QOG82_2229 [Actinomycetota bacterium]|jgi:phosphosulfolactate phosphohydrolase-like enzyme|nr:hypothetical protein [Actinomycetota bacterium]
MSGERTGLLTIRVWMEEGSTEPLRAEVRISTDVSAGFERIVTFTRPEQVCATVAAWLAGMLSAAQPPAID